MTKRTCTDGGDAHQAVKNNPLRVDWNALEVRYTTTRGDELRFRYDTDYGVDNQGGQRVEVDWSGELPRISRRCPLRDHSN